MKYFFVFLSSIFISSTLFAQSDAEISKQRLQVALKSLDSISASFEQTVINDNQQVIQQSTGYLSIERPKKFNWTYKTPYEQQIIADGEEIWVYDVDLKQVSVKPFDQQVANSPIMILINDELLDNNFEVNEIGQKQFLYWVELTPKQQGGQFERLYFGLKNKQIMALDLRDTFGQSTQIVFKNHRYNVIHNPEIFSFNATPDIDVFNVE